MIAFQSTSVAEIPHSNRTEKPVTQYFEVPTISAETALQLVSAVIRDGQQRGLSFAATVVDPSLRLVAFCRADNANPLAFETTRRAAQTALVDDRASGWMPPESAVVLALASGELHQQCHRGSADPLRRPTRRGTRGGWRAPG